MTNFCKRQLLLGSYYIFIRLLLFSGIKSFVRGLFLLFLCFVKALVLAARRSRNPHFMYLYRDAVGRSRRYKINFLYLFVCLFYLYVSTYCRATQKWVRDFILKFHRSSASAKHFTLTVHHGKGEVGRSLKISTYWTKSCLRMLEIVVLCGVSLGKKT